MIATKFTWLKDGSRITKGHGGLVTSNDKLLLSHPLVLSLRQERGSVNTPPPPGDVTSSPQAKTKTGAAVDGFLEQVGKIREQRHQLEAGNGSNNGRPGKTCEPRVTTFLCRHHAPGLVVVLRKFYRHSSLLSCDGRVGVRSFSPCEGRHRCSAITYSDFVHKEPQRVADFSINARLRKRRAHSSQRAYTSVVDR
jgi:hypothetical protein